MQEHSGEHFPLGLPPLPRGFLVLGNCSHASLPNLKHLPMTVESLMFQLSMKSLSYH